MQNSYEMVFNARVRQLAMSEGVTNLVFNLNLLS